MREKVVDRPPRKVAGNTKNNWERIAELARANPGKWVKAPVSVHRSVAHSIRAGRYRYVKPEQFDVTVRTIDGLTYIYVQFRD